MIWRTRRTWCGIRFGELARPIPERVLESDSDVAAHRRRLGGDSASGCARPPSTDQCNSLPNSRSAVRFMCATSSGCAPMPPRMPNTLLHEERRPDQAAIDEVR